MGNRLTGYRRYEMVPLYNTVALQTIQFSDVQTNMEQLAIAIDMAHNIGSQELPVKLICLAESAIQGFPLDDPPITEIPGPETAFFAEKAKELDAYIIGELLFVKMPGIPEDRVFNCLFIIDPKGDVIYTRPKSQLEAIEAQWTTTPHDVWDLWVEQYGSGLDAFYPVVETEIGNIGCAVCMERGYPEIARGLAMNGAEILYMPTYHEPFVGNGMFEVHTRARAFDNTCYVISPNSGSYLLPGMKAPFDICGGQSLIADFKGNIIGRHETTDNSFACAMIDIQTLRRYRQSVLGIGNTLKDLRTEQYRIIYDEPVYPKNLRRDGDMPDAEELLEKERKILRDNISLLEKKKIYTPPS
jgi:predicted amidohydrolase